MKNLIKAIIVLVIGCSSFNSFGQSFMDRMKEAKEEKSVQTTQPSTPQSPTTDKNTQSTYQPKTTRPSTSTSSNSFVQLKNRWKGIYIHTENGLTAGRLGKPGWHSAQWELEPVLEDRKYVRIKNRWKGTYLHVESGRLTAGRLGQPGWHSAQWELVTVTEDRKYVRIKNRWKGTYLHVETGQLTAGRLGEPGWHSAQWEMLNIKDGSTSGSTLSGNAAAAAAYTSSNHANAVDMYFRYTDQVQGGGSLNLKVGDRVKVLPNQTISDAFLNRKTETYQGKTYYGKSGLSFDPKNPKICGKIFTVASVSPLKFKEEFPEKMRNTSNSSFTFKVIKL